MLGSGGASSRECSFSRGRDDGVADMMVRRGAVAVADTQDYRQ